MKRLTYILILAAAVLTGCKVDWGDEFEPTRLGADFSRQFGVAVKEQLDDVFTLMFFREYLKAEGDEERLAAHDTYFYSARIVEREEGEWHIISNNSTLVVLTSDCTLDAEDDTWRFAFVDTSGYISDEYSTLTRLANDGGSEGMRLRIEMFEGKTVVMDVIADISEAKSPASDKEATGYRIDLAEGSGLIGGQDDGFTYTILDAVQRDSYQSEYIFNEGRISMSQEIDGTFHAPEAEFLGSDGVMIFGGKDNAYKMQYSYYNRYYYYWY